MDVPTLKWRQNCYWFPSASDQTTLVLLYSSQSHSPCLKPTNPTDTLNQSDAEKGRVLAKKKKKSSGIHNDVWITDLFMSTKPTSSHTFPQPPPFSNTPIHTHTRAHALLDLRLAFFWGPSCHPPSKPGSDVLGNLRFGVFPAAETLQLPCWYLIWLLFTHALSRTHTLSQHLRKPQPAMPEVVITHRRWRHAKLL